ncbi:hypothetical protein M0802_009690 [Mischocyttarus mexicanus]|nr:hypothetical protein M0802_009690 [Mischocyttarus mexicanus]
MQKYAKVNRQITLAITLVVLDMVIIVTTTSFFLCIRHACAILSIIILKIDQPMKKNTKDPLYDWSSETMFDAHNWIKDIVKRHAGVIKFIDLLNALCGKVALIVLICGSLSVTISGIYAYGHTKSPNLKESFVSLLSRINRPFEGNEDSLFLNKINDHQDWLKDITKRYIYAIYFVDLINSLSEKVYVIEMLLALLFIGIDFLHMFQISSMMENITGSLIYFVYIPGSILVLYLQCYVGQRLLDHSAEILETSSCIPFYKTSIKCQKGIIMLILRSTKSSKLSIGGLFTCSHYFFSELMQKSLSYAMVCYAMR